MLFQSQAQEPDLGQPPDDDRNMTIPQFLKRLQKAFARFAAVEAEAVLDMSVLTPLNQVLASRHSVCIDSIVGLDCLSRYAAQFAEGGAQMAYDTAQ